MHSDAALDTSQIATYLPSGSSIQMLCLTMITLHGLYSFIPKIVNRCLYSSKNTARKAAQPRMFLIVLTSGAVSAVGACLANAYHTTCLFTAIVPWTIGIGHVFDTYTQLNPASRSRASVKGAVSSFLLILLSVSPCELAQCVHTLSMRVIGMAVSLSLLCGFLSIPRQPHMFFQGRLVDRQQTGSFLELLTFSWPRTIFCLENLRTLTVNDLPGLLPTYGAQHLSHQHARIIDKRRSLILNLAKFYAMPILLQWTLSVLRSFAILAPELVTYRLLQWLSGDLERSVNQGVALATLLGLSKVAEILVDAWLKWVTSSMIQLPIQAAMNALVYQKTLCLSSGSDSSDEDVSKKPSLSQMRMHSGKASVLYTDAHRIAMILIKLTSTTTFLVSLVGWTSLGVGLLASALVMPLTVLLSKKYGAAQMEQANFHRQRSAALSDALLAIRQIKLSAVEGEWRMRLSDLRDKELHQLFSGAVWMSSLVFASNISPLILAGILLYVFTFQEGQLTAAVAFTTISLFQQLQLDISILPLTTPPLWEAWNSLRQLEAFLSMDELDTAKIIHSQTITLNKATITWQGSEGAKSRFVLNNLSLEFPDGELSLITGKTGSGKSLLLAAIAGEAKLISGSIHCPRKNDNFDAKVTDGWVSPDHVALVSQSPWIDNITIRESILFGLPFNEKRYDKIILSCALDKDLGMLKNGDSTMVGIKGVTLSGGQRWRIALARALYSRARLILMDDVLSAVDTEVRGWIVDRALFGDFMKGRTRILATHHVSECLSRAAYHVELGDGMARAQLLSRVLPLASDEKPKFNDLEGHFEDKGQPQKQHNARATSSLAINQIRSNSSREVLPYRIYFNATGGKASWLLVLLATAAYEMVGLTTSWWLKEWASQHRFENGSDPYRVSYGLSYILMAALSCLVTAARCFVWFKIGMIASKRLFETMMTATLGAQLHWLEDTSHGEILTRFSQDMNAIDKRLPHDVGYLIECLTKLFSILFTSVTFSFYETPIIAILLYLYFKIWMRLISATRKLKTVRLTASATLLQHLSSLQAPDAIMTIRVYSKSCFFMDRMHRYIDDNSSAIWHSALCSVMMDFQLGVLGALFVTSSCLFIVLTSTDAGTAGVALSFATKFSTTMTGLLQRIATVEAGLNSVQRVSEYSEICQESTSGIDVPESWPSEGRVQVRGLTAGYSADLPAALHNVTFSINPGERVGVVGRTGAGKSSLALAFARLIQLRDGCVMIDGISTSTVQVDVLRRRLLIIPQDPYIFAGSLRSVLDPDGSYKDAQLLASLRRVRGTASSTEEEVAPGDLSFRIEDGGSNLSQGERQILYLARALLARKKVIIMDEATSAVDMETDTATQNAIRDGLRGTTVVVIAHRLATVADFDKILVLEDGTVAEFGAPKDLYLKKGPFSKLVNHSSDKAALLERIVGSADGA